MKSQLSVSLPARSSLSDPFLYYAPIVFKAVQRPVPVGLRPHRQIDKDQRRQLEAHLLVRLEIVVVIVQTFTYSLKSLLVVVLLQISMSQVLEANLRLPAPTSAAHAEVLPSPRCDNRSTVTTISISHSRSLSCRELRVVPLSNASGLRESPRQLVLLQVALAPRSLHSPSHHVARLLSLHRDSYPVLEQVEEVRLLPEVPVLDPVLRSQNIPQPLRTSLIQRKRRAGQVDEAVLLLRDLIFFLDWRAVLVELLFAVGAGART